MGKGGKGGFEKVSANGYKRQRVPTTIPILVFLLSLAGWSITAEFSWRVEVQELRYSDDDDDDDGDKLPWKALEADSIYSVNKQPTFPACNNSSSHAHQTLKDSQAPRLPPDAFFFSLSDPPKHYHPSTN